MRILILGAGGHAKVVADIVRLQGHEVAGFLDDDEELIGGEPLFDADQFDELLQESIELEGNSMCMEFAETELAALTGEDSDPEKGSDGLDAIG